MLKGLARSLHWSPLEEEKNQRKSLWYYFALVLWLHWYRPHIFVGKMITQIASKPEPFELVFLRALQVRPTSETIVNHMFTKWIHSYRDLPLMINQVTSLANLDQLQTCSPLLFTILNSSYFPSGLMSQDGKCGLNHSSELLNFYGKKVIQPMPPLRRQRKRLVSHFVSVLLLFLLLKFQSHACNGAGKPSLEKQ